MAWITVPADNLKIGTNIINIWNADSEPGTLTKFRIRYSPESGQLKQAFATDGALIGTGAEGANVTTAKAADKASRQLIEDMAADHVLSPSEKATWRQSWVNITASYDKAIAYAESLTVPTTALSDAYTGLQATLTLYAIWTSPDSPSLISGSILADAYQAYSTAYRGLSEACTDKVADDAKEAAKVFTQGWSVEGADVTGDNTSADTANVAGTPAGTITSDLSTAKTNASSALTAVTSMADDGYLSVDEKKTWRQVWPSIDENYNVYQAKGTRLGVSYASLGAAKTALFNYLTLNGVWINETTPNSINGAELITVTKDYYNTLETFLEDCSTKNQEEAIDGADSSRNNWWALGPDISAAKVSGVTIIDGGYLRTNLIDADTLFTGRLVADEIIGDVTKSAPFNVTSYGASVANGAWSDYGVTTLAASPVNRTPYTAVAIQANNVGSGSAVGSAKLEVTLTDGSLTQVNEYHFIVYGHGTGSAVMTGSFVTKATITAKFRVYNVNCGTLILDNLNGVVMGLR